MNIEKYKIELESAIYEGADGKFFIGGKMIEKVLNDYHNEQLNLPPVIKSVCPHCGSESDNIAEPRKYKCGNCNRLFYEQTVL